VVLRYHRQHSGANLEVAVEAEKEDLAQEQSDKAIVVAEKMSCD